MYGTKILTGMKKILLLIVALVAAAAVDAAAQDVITMRTGEDVKAQIVEVTDDAVKYKKENLPDGPLFTISKSQVLMVTYSDGSRDVFADAQPQAYSAPESDTILPADQLASLRPGMKYRELREYYDFRDYYAKFRGYERYDLFVGGLCSFLIPGLGQMIAGEWGRGAGFLAGYIGCASLMFYSLGIAALGEPGFGGGLALASSIAAVALNIYSIVDAVRVAKVKNMYNYDMEQLAYNLDLTPYVDLAYTGPQTLSPVAGLSLRLSF